MTENADTPARWAREEVRDLIRRHCQRNFLYLHIEPTNNCNTHCQMCPRESMNRAVRIMGWDTFTRIANVCINSRLPMVSIVGFGEPTLHPLLPSMISEMRARQPKMIIKLTTNGSILTPPRIDALYSAGLDFLELSFVGHSRATYEEIMRLDFDTTVANADHLKRSGKKFFISTLEMMPGDRERILTFWAQRGIRDVQIKGMHRRGRYLKNFLTPGSNPLGDYVSRNRNAVKEGPGYTRSDECHKLLMFLHVSVTGEFVPCVQEINSRNVLFRIEDVLSLDDIVSRMHDVRSNFDICDGCELKEQDHMDYYAAFLIRHFPHRLAELFADASHDS